MTADIRVCTQCKNCALTGSPWLEKMVVFGFVGCRLERIEYQCVSPGFARICLAFDDGTRAPLPTPEIETALPPLPARKKTPTNLFDF